MDLRRLFIPLLLVAGLVALAALVIWRNPSGPQSYARHGLEYEAAAEWVMRATKAPDEGQVLRVELPPEYRDLTTAGLAFRLRDRADYVYFVIGGEVTMPEGLLYSADANARPEALFGDIAPTGINDRWWFGAIPASFLEAGRLEL